MKKGLKTLIEDIAISIGGSNTREAMIEAFQEGADAIETELKDRVPKPYLKIAREIIDRAIRDDEDIETVEGEIVDDDD